MVIDKFIEIKEFTDTGYSPVVDFESWRVAVLNYIDELLPENIDNMQKHDETDEVFVLLSGRCILFIGEGKEKIEEISAVDMEPMKIYNIKKGVYHTHTLSKDAKLIIVENRNTDDSNSPKINLSNENTKNLVETTNSLWGK